MSKRERETENERERVCVCVLEGEKLDLISDTVRKQSGYIINVKRLLSFLN